MSSSSRAHSARPTAGRASPEICHTFGEFPTARDSSRADRVPHAEAPIISSAFLRSRLLQESDGRPPARLASELPTPASDALPREGTGTVVREAPLAQTLHAEPPATGADAEVETHDLPARVRAVLSCKDNLNVLAPRYADIWGRLDQQEETSFAMHDQVRSVLGILQREVEELKYRTTRLDSATGELSDHLVALRRQIAAPPTAATSAHRR